MDTSTDQELFDAAINGTEPQIAAEPVETQSETAPAQARDDAGRFTAKEEPAAEPADPEQPVEPQPEAAKPGYVPSSRLKEEADGRRAERERADRLEGMLQQLLSQQKQQPQTTQQPAQPAPDIFEAPDAWAEQRIQSTVTPVMQQMHAVLMHNAELVASSVLGAEKVAAAKQWFKEAQTTGQLTPEEAGRINANPNPFEAAVKAHQRHQALSTIGDDIEAYNQKIIAEHLAKTQTAQPTAVGRQAPGTIVKLPSNLARITSAAPSAPGTEPALGDAELFEQTISNRR